MITKAIFQVFLYSSLLFDYGAAFTSLKSVSRGVKLHQSTTKDVATASNFLAEAVRTRAADSEEIIETLLNLEKQMRDKSKNNKKVAESTLKNLTGSWRLIFTTGEMKTQKKIGKINYVPIKAVQEFDVSTSSIANGIYIGDFPIVKFFGEFQWIEKMRKTNFDFDQIAVFGLKFDLPPPKTERKVPPFFSWILIDENIAVARGGGGGLALWGRI
mmetsp:Transcript_41123/g.42010  ORF Transcript_41123/g.42010 Transcript_41123/m.42010 type:complete len:215 (-) Transcript_41123:85-729(-)|eukprot:CAMPEP_0182416300 /NCGR_PEP_ID=MMETSP1167-20130531/571_1 /TAXON_ID=2988 /ORGANISM="Mallomonas Sp, Strain CCMP3275" /LENGTH=214 /DNA_ID=CAMNT_0024588947 /DNA_START=25 /DNA_END=669 /DNA_ORIENTATION=+